MITVWLAACNPGKRLAHEFIRNHEGTAVFVIPTYQLGLDNLVISYDTNMVYSEAQYDSIAWVQSCYIKQLSDSVFLTRFTNSLVSELDKCGFDVYLGDTRDAFNQLPTPGIIVKIAQLHINETHTTRMYEVFYEKIQGYEYENAYLRMNMLNMLSWFEINTADSNKMQLLFRDEAIVDHLTQGFDFVMNKGNEGLQQNRDSLELADVYNLADESGRGHAWSVYDFLMNEYISRNLTTSLPEQPYYYYDRKTRSLKTGINEWIEIPVGQ